MGAHVERSNIVETRDLIELHSTDSGGTASREERKSIKNKEEGEVSTEWPHTNVTSETIRLSSMPRTKLAKVRKLCKSDLKDFLPWADG